MYLTLNTKRCSAYSIIQNLSNTSRCTHMKFTNFLKDKHVRMLDHEILLEIVNLLTLTTSWAAMDPMTACMGDTSPQARYENFACRRSSISSTCMFMNTIYR